ncbi:hypothetical protein EZV61_02320 [Corallincola luteus]|uniref:Uncharacterized protein n=1 Tax=Corallincola luteus TaxID=1775177 RepID=A0ABY2ANQ3_9GAMM|nr:hypothetical protein [Corallincola luteus]TCI04829.1 hypothetical protein EZV61_02320 [Corallincola luteus]
MNDKQLDALLAQLPTEQQPKRDLWPDIEEQLVDPTVEVTPAEKRRWLAVAALALLTFSSWNFMFKPSDDPDIEIVINIERTAAEQIVANFSLQKNALLKTIAAVGLDISPWQTELILMDSAEQEIQKALTLQPDNQKLLSMLRDLNNKQIQLLNTLIRFTA